MADLLIQSADNVVMWINDAAAADASKVFQVVHLSGPNPPVIFEVREVNDVVVVYGAFRKLGSHVLNNTTAGDGTIATFQRGSTEIVSFTYDSAYGASIRTPDRSDHDLAFKSAKDLVLRAGAFGGVGLRTPAGNNLWLTSTGGATWTTDAGVIQMNWIADTTDFQMQVGGTAAGFRASVHVRADTTVGRPGILVLEREDGTPYYLFVRASDSRLHIHTSDPGTNDALGTEVRTQ